MGYIDKNLTDDESIIYRTKLHWMIFCFPTIFFIIFLFGLIRGDSPANVALIVISIVWFIMVTILRATSEFGISNKRILIKKGVIRRASFETLLAKVEGIQVKQGIIGRIFDYGTITIVGTGGSHTPFRKITKPFTFRKIAQKQITEASSSSKAN